MESFIKWYVPTFMVIYFSVALFLKTYLQYRKTGVNPLTFGQRKESAHDYVGFWFKLILASIFVHGLLYVTIAIPRIEELAGLIFQASGICLTVTSLAFTVYSQNTMGNSWRIGIDAEVKTELITSGVYGYIRNPIFLGMIITLLGLFLLSPTWIMFGLLLMSYVLINIQVRMEEEHLLKIHGDEYSSYKNRTGRFMPF